jgi:hypothetical protein
MNSFGIVVADRNRAFASIAAWTSGGSPSIGI